MDKGPPKWDQVSRSGKEHVSSDTTPINDTAQGSTSDSTDVSLSQLEDAVQSAVNDFASTGQPQELNAFVAYIRARFPSIKNVELPPISIDSINRTASSIETLEHQMYLLIREFQTSLNASYSSKNTENCITDQSLLLGKYIASLPKVPLDSPLASENGSSSGSMKLESSVLRPRYDNFCPSGADGIYVSSCGHAVHQGCLDRYLSSLKER